MEAKTHRKDMTLTVDEIRDLVDLIDKAEEERGRPFSKNHYVSIQQVLRPTRTSTAAQLPDRSVFVKIGSKASSNA